MADMKQVMQAIDANGKVQTVYKKIVDLGGGLYADATAATLTGSSVVIGGVTFAVSGGDTLRNTSANKPTASAAHTAIPYCYYYSVDTGVVEATDGTNWVVV